MMVSFFWTLQVILTFHISTALESIVNPSSSTVSCGTNDNCTVTCNATESCEGKTFHFYNNTIHFLCSGDTACKDVKIFTSNVQSFTSSMTGTKSFSLGRLYTSSTDIDIHVQCGPSSNLQECFGASFYYLNQGQSTHICEGEESCRRSMIHAVTPVALVCKQSSSNGLSLSCASTSFVLPTDEQLNHQSSLTVYSEYAHRTSTMKLYSLYPFTNIISADGVALDWIHFVYGMRFNQYCIVSDTSCMDAVATNIDNYDELTIINTYPDGIPSPSSTYNGDVLICATFEHTTFTPPSIPDTNTLSILCLDCWAITFQLGGVSNAVLSDASGQHLWYSTITGPSDTFELNIMHWSQLNKYYLQNTSTITAQSFGENAEVYLGKTLDVYVTCTLQSDGSLYWKCPNTNIWSTLQRNEIHLGTSPGYWNLDTSYEFLIHFDFEQYPCTYINYVSNCSFLTFNPTGAPTQPPSPPSQSPSQQTEIPSSIPTHTPSHYPSSQPTKQPTPMTRVPSRPPSKFPTLKPTHGGEQEVNDATDTTDTVEPESVVSDQSSIERIIVAIAISLGVVIIGTATVLIVCYMKGKSTADKTMETLEPTEYPSAQQGNMNMNQISNSEAIINDAIVCNGQLMSTISGSKPALELVTSDSSKPEMGTEYTTEGNDDGNTVNIAADEFIIDGDDEIHATIR